MNIVHNYYSIGDQNRLNQFTNWKNPLLLTFRYIQSGTVETAQFHQHSHLEIFYIKSGDGVFELLPHGSVPLKANTLLVINANVRHRQYSLAEKEPVQYYNFFVDSVYLPQLICNTISDRPYEIFSFADEQNICLYSIQEILNELGNKAFAYYQRVYALFTQLFIDVLRLFRNSSSPRATSKILNNEQRILDIKGYIDEHFSEDISLEMLAQKSYLNKSYFLKQFKAIVGIPPMQYLTAVRISQAKLLLTKTNDTISEISLNVGFGNPVYFTEVFHKCVGVSPTRFRKLELT